MQPVCHWFTRNKQTQQEEVTVYTRVLLRWQSSRSLSAMIVAIGLQWIGKNHFYPETPCTYLMWNVCTSSGLVCVEEWRGYTGIIPWMVFPHSMGNVIEGCFILLCTGCSLNIVFFFLKVLWFFSTLRVLLQRWFSTCLVCVHTRTPRENRERPESGIFLKNRKKHNI